MSGFWGFMNASALPLRPLRLRILLSAGFGVALMLGAAVSSPADAVAGTHVVARGRAAAAGGIWEQAKKVPGLAALNSGGRAVVSSVSCAAAGECSAGGFYIDGSVIQGFVVKET